MAKHPRVEPIREPTLFELDKLEEARIQQANDLSYWRFTSVRVDLRENGALASEADLKRLPELLSLYARNVRKKVETDQAFSNVDNVHDLEFEVTEALLSWIKQRTDRRYRDRVASIQTTRWSPQSAIEVASVCNQDKL